jgi:hypothetical protein
LHSLPPSQKQSEEKLKSAAELIMVPEAPNVSINLGAVMPRTLFLQSLSAAELTMVPEAPNVSINLGAVIPRTLFLQTLSAAEVFILPEVLNISMYSVAAKTWAPVQPGLFLRRTIPDAVILYYPL